MQIIAAILAIWVLGLLNLAFSMPPEFLRRAGSNEDKTNRWRVTANDESNTVSTKGGSSIVGSRVD